MPLGIDLPERVERVRAERHARVVADICFEERPELDRGCSDRHGHQVQLRRVRAGLLSGKQRGLAALGVRIALGEAATSAVVCIDVGTQNFWGVSAAQEGGVF